MNLKIFLSEQANWRQVLSGGQKKKISLASVFMQKSNFIILDEVLVGLDHKSLSLAKDLIKKELSNAIVMLIDHNAKKNNNNNFYTDEMHFANQSITIKDIDFYHPEEQSIEEIFLFEENICQYDSTKDLLGEL